MPSSAIETVPYIIEFLRKHIPKPRRVLDIGVGFGKIGFLVREYYEARNGRFAKKDWQCELIGIEVYKPYLSAVQKQLYDHIIIGKVEDKLPALGKFDVAILSDVLEHFEKEQGRKLLAELLLHSKYVLIALPYGWKPQGAIGKNKHEAHKSGWIPSDFKQWTIVEKAIVKRITKKEEKVLIVLLRK